MKASSWARETRSEIFCVSRLNELCLKMNSSEFCMSFKWKSSRSSLLRDTFCVTLRIFSSSFLRIFSISTLLRNSAFLKAVDLKAAWNSTVMFTVCRGDSCLHFGKILSPEMKNGGGMNWNFISLRDVLVTRKECELSSLTWTRGKSTFSEENSKGQSNT